jgi:hypothetical protein
MHLSVFPPGISSNGDRQKAGHRQIFVVMLKTNDQIQEGRNGRAISRPYRKKDNSKSVVKVLDIDDMKYRWGFAHRQRMEFVRAPCLWAIIEQIFWLSRGK